MTLLFFWIFSKVFSAAISNHPHNSIIMAWSLEEFWVVDYSSVLIKTGLQQRPFLKYFGDEIISTKAVCDGFLFW